MKVIRIDSEINGFIGLAKNCTSAIKFLYNTKQLSKNTRIWDEEEQIWRPLKELCDIKEILSLDLESFNYIFDCVFSLEEIEVYE